MLDKKNDKYYEIDNKALGKLIITPLISNYQNYQLFKEIVCDINIMKTSSLFNGRISNDEEDIKYYFNIFTKINLEYGYGFYKLFDNKNNFIGLSGLILLEKNVDNTPKILEIAYFLKKEFHNKKIASDFSLFVLNQFLSKFNYIKKIIGTSFSNNIPSQIIMLKMGFRYLGRGIKRGANINYYNLVPEKFIADISNSKKTKEVYIKYISKINQDHPVDLVEVDDYVV